MKKILNWVLPAFLGIVPVLGMDEVGVINDPFFIKENMARSISRVVENGPKIMAQVTVTDDTGITKSKLAEALCAPVGWQNNDDQLNAQEIINAQIICGPDLLEKHHVRALRVPYTLEKETEGKFLQGVPMKEDDALPVGEAVEVCKLIDYKRPDGTHYIKSGETLYELLLEETRAPGPEFRHCQREWYEISKFKKITRHQVQTYSRTDVKRTMYRISDTGDKVEISTVLTPELKPSLFEPEVPTCGQKNWPANYKIVS